MTEFVPLLLSLFTATLLGALAAIVWLVDAAIPFCLTTYQQVNARLISK